MSSDQAAAPPTATMKDDGKGAAEQAVKCPRCDSPNTKFCYYNNYSLTQPRHFCKTCRRYWTKGGALRNVPIGGGCRKNKKIKSSSDAKFFTGPAMDFQLGSSSSFPRVLQHQYGHYMTAQFSSSSALDSPGSSVPPALGGALQEMNNKITTSGSGLACSIESLSCINQDLHWKLQQQRLAMLFGNTNGGADNNSATVPLNSRKEGGADVATEWFFGSSYSNHTTGGGGDWDTGVQGAFALHSDTI